MAIFQEDCSNGSSGSDSSSCFECVNVIVVGLQKDNVIVSA